MYTVCACDIYVHCIQFNVQCLRLISIRAHVQEDALITIGRDVIYILTHTCTYMHVPSHTAVW